MQQYNTIIIGAGPSGYSLALKLASNNKQVCLIEKDSIGGVCLNRGCIPTKVLANVAKKYHEIDSLSSYGINISKKQFDFSIFKQKQQSVIERIKKGLEFSFKKTGVNFKLGTATGYSDDIVKVKIDDQEEELKYENLVIATGSKPVFPEIFKKKNVVTSEQFWSLDDIPENIIIVGGGVIGCEYASSLAKLGFNIILIEKEERLLCAEDKDISNQVLMDLKRSGVNVSLGKSLEKIEDNNLYVLCLGRYQDYDSLGITVNQDDMNSLNLKDNIWLAGDITKGPQLAHKAYYDSSIIADEILNKKAISPNYNNIPMSIFTIPEASRVGLTEEDASIEYEIITGKVSFAEVGKAIADNNVRGFLKYVKDKKTDTILGISIYGDGAAEMINTAALIVKNKMTSKDLQSFPFSHPTISEIFKKIV